MPPRLARSRSRSRSDPPPADAHGLLHLGFELPVRHGQDCQVDRFAEFIERGDGFEPMHGLVTRVHHVYLALETAQDQLPEGQIAN
jgi:hypothetical protein